MPAEGCSRCPSFRMAADGSTATTSNPRDASQAASRPVPPPTSSTRAGASGRRSNIQAWTSAATTDSYRWTTSAAFRSYHAIALDIGGEYAVHLVGVEHKEATPASRVEQRVARLDTSPTPSLRPLV